MHFKWPKGHVIITLNAQNYPDIYGWCKMTGLQKETIHIEPAWPCYGSQVESKKISADLHSLLHNLRGKLSHSRIQNIYFLSYPIINILIYRNNFGVKKQMCIRQYVMISRRNISTIHQLQNCMGILDLISFSKDSKFLVGNHLNTIKTQEGTWKMASLSKSRNKGSTSIKYPVPTSTRTLSASSRVPGT